MSSTAERRSPSAGGWARGIRFSWFTFVMLGIVVIAVFVLSPTVRMYLAQRSQVSQLQRANNAQQAQIDSLDRLASSWRDPNFVEAQARSQLMYVKPGETSYLIIDDLPATSSAPKQRPTTTAQRENGDWAATLLDSILSASATSPGTAR